MRRAMTCVNWEPKSRTAIVCGMRSYGGLAASESIPIRALPGSRVLFPQARVRPMRDVGLKHGQRQCAFHKERVVEGTDIEPSTESLFGERSYFEKLQLADLVT